MTTVRQLRRQAQRVTSPSEMMALFDNSISPSMPSPRLPTPPNDCKTPLESVTYAYVKALDSRQEWQTIIDTLKLVRSSEHWTSQHVPPSILRYAVKANVHLKRLRDAQRLIPTKYDSTYSSAVFKQIIAALVRRGEETQNELLFKHARWYFRRAASHHRVNRAMANWMLRAFVNSPQEQLHIYHSFFNTSSKKKLKLKPNKATAYYLILGAIQANNLKLARANFDHFFGATSATKTWRLDQRTASLYPKLFEKSNIVQEST